MEQFQLRFWTQNYIKCYTPSLQNPQQVKSRPKKIYYEFIRKMFSLKSKNHKYLQNEQLTQIFILKVDQLIIFPFESKFSF